MHLRVRLYMMFCNIIFILDNVSNVYNLFFQSPNFCSIVVKRRLYKSSPVTECLWSGIWQYTIKKAVKLRPQNSDELCGIRGEWTQTCSGAADIWRLAVGDSAQHELFSSESRRPIFLVNSSRCYFSIDAHLQRTFLFVVVLCRAS